MELYTLNPDAGFLNESTASEAHNTTSSNYVNSTIKSIGKSRGVSRFYPIIITELVLSTLCLLVTIFVYSVLPSLKNVHGKNLITICWCLVCAFVFLTLDILLRTRLSSGSCYAFALIIHFSFLANFFWTNVMAFDICKSMTDLKPKTESRGSKKYLKYSIYAWTATVATALPAVIFDQTEWLPVDYRPNFGVNRCWLSGTRAFVLYFNAPVGVLLLSNLIMFLVTIWSLMKIKKMTDKMNIKKQQQRFNLHAKLLFVVGAIWLTEFLPWATGIYGLYALAGMLTCLHGVLLFLIFVCKRRILNQICQKYDIRFCSSYFLEQKSTMTNSSSAPATNSNKLASVQRDLSHFKT